MEIEISKREQQAIDNVRLVLMQRYVARKNKAARRALAAFKWLKRKAAAVQVMPAIWILCNESILDWAETAGSVECLTACRQLDTLAARHEIDTARGLIDSYGDVVRIEDLKSAAAVLEIIEDTAIGQRLR